MIDRERLATCLLAILLEPEWRTRMLPPLEIHEPTEEELAHFRQHAREESVVGRLWRVIVEVIERDDGTLPKEMTDEYRARQLAHFVASTWVELIEITKKRGMNGLDERSMPVPSVPELERAWNDGAPQFGLTGQDFSDLIGEALERMSARGDSVV